MSFFLSFFCRWLDIDKLLVCGGNLDHNADLGILSEKGGFEVKVILLNNTGKVSVRCPFSWRGWRGGGGG
jgi:hypothetical protein